jgi:hypothetical protein
VSERECEVEREFSITETVLGRVCNWGRERPWVEDICHCGVQSSRTFLCCVVLCCAPKAQPLPAAGVRHVGVDARRDGPPLEEADTQTVGTRQEQGELQRITGVLRMCEQGGEGAEPQAVWARQEQGE